MFQLKESKYAEEQKVCCSCKKWIDTMSRKLYLKHDTLYFHTKCLQKVLKDSI